MLLRHSLLLPSGGQRVSYFALSLLATWRVGCVDKSKKLCVSWSLRWEEEEEEEKNADHDSTLVIKFDIK